LNRRRGGARNNGKMSGDASVYYKYVGPSIYIGIFKLRIYPDPDLNKVALYRSLPVNVGLRR